MGLDTTHDAWHGAYSAFSRWRSKLAEVAGYPDINDGYGLDWTRFTEANLYGRGWAGVEVDDALIYLLVHSDCDGKIKPKYAAKIADRLVELLPLLPDEDDHGHIGNWREKTQTFIDGLRLAVAQGKSVKFW